MQDLSMQGCDGERSSGGGSDGSGATRATVVVVVVVVVVEIFRLHVLKVHPKPGPFR